MARKMKKPTIISRRSRQDVVRAEIERETHFSRLINEAREVQEENSRDEESEKDDETPL